MTKITVFDDGAPSVSASQQYERHPFAQLFPEMGRIQSEALTDSIRANGLTDAIVLHEGKILDGWDRYRSCLASGTQPRFRQFNVETEGDPFQFVLQHAFLRKHWSDPQRAMIAARLVTSKPGFNQYSEGTTVVGAAKMANVHLKMVERAMKVLRTSTVVAEAVRQGRIETMRVATKLAELPLTIQQDVIAGQESGSAMKKKIHDAERKWRLTQTTVIPKGRFPVIIADPAWPMDKAPYPTMTLPEIENDLRKLLADKAATDCRLFLWTTQANLPHAHMIIKALGWTYDFQMTWRKAGGPKHPDGPMYNEEFVIVASKGLPTFTDTRDFKTGFSAKKGRHSEKPHEFYEVVKRVTAGPRLELYTRNPHEGFEAHGNEITAEMIPLIRSESLAPSSELSSLPNDSKVSFDQAAE